MTIAEQDGGLLVQVQDDGVGFAAEIPRVSALGHMGLSSMRERAELQGGWCELWSVPAGGPTVRFWLSVTSERPVRIAPGHETSASPGATPALTR
ncbi:MAG: hypothetical protein H0W82_03040 [Actinobacteria bacterium]|nr:hypothetical protein [Actinomycetota bacterium]